MRDLTKIVVEGSLLSLEKRKTKAGMDYIEGRLLCNTPLQMQITFACFNKEVCQRLLRENPVGERLKVQGNIKSHGLSTSISIYKAERARTKYDKAEFVVIGILKNITERGNLLNIALEAKTFFRGRFYIHSLEINTYNRPLIKKRLLNAQGKRVLAKGNIKEVSDRAGSKTCWLTSIDILQEEVLRSPIAKVSLDNSSGIQPSNTEAIPKEDEGGR